MSSREQLEKQVAKRKLEAERKNIGLKADFVASYLGGGHDNPGCNGREDTFFQYEDDNFCITHRYYCDYGTDGMYGGGGNTIVYKEKVVYQDAISPVLSYVPGEWEEELERLYDAACVIRTKEMREKAKQLKEREEKEQQKMKDKWGL